MTKVCSLYHARDTLCQALTVRLEGICTRVQPLLVCSAGYTLSRSGRYTKHMKNTYTHTVLFAAGNSETMTLTDAVKIMRGYRKIGVWCVVVDADGYAVPSSAFCVV